MQTLQSQLQNGGVPPAQDRRGPPLISDNYETIWGLGQAIPRGQSQAPSQAPKDPAAAMVDDETLGVGGLPSTRRSPRPFDQAGT